MDGNRTRVCSLEGSRTHHLCYHGSDSFRVIYKVKTLRPCRAIPLSPLIRELHPYSRVVRSHTLRRSYFLHGF